MKLAVQLAREVLEMQADLEDLHFEVARLRVIEEKYYELMNDSLAHSEKMVGQTLRLLMTPGVVEACVKNAQEPA